MQFIQLHTYFKILKKSSFENTHIVQQLYVNGVQGFVQITVC